MTWNKCSEKLPEVGMLVVTRYLAGNAYFYAAEEVRKLKERVDSLEAVQEHLLQNIK